MVQLPKDTLLAAITISLDDCIDELDLALTNNDWKAVWQVEQRLGVIQTLAMGGVSS